MPSFPFALLLVGTALAAKDDRAGAVLNYGKALERVKAEDQRARIRQELAKLKD